MKTFGIIICISIMSFLSSCKSKKGMTDQNKTENTIPALEILDQPLDKSFENHPFELKIDTLEGDILKMTVSYTGYI